MSVTEWDLEAEMQAETADTGRAERARARIAGHTRASVLASPDAALMAAARRTVSHQGTDNPVAVHAWLHRLEDDVIDLLLEHEQMRFRSDT